tara:strand:- start:339 stop:590 length:252 start_codon:yes stop_codon:yes gene_type:complete
MSDPFDLEVLRTLDKKPLNEAKTIALDILDKSDTKATRLNRLKYDINRANTAIEVTRIMWTTYMAGTGYRVHGSSWDKHYRSV